MQTGQRQAGATERTQARQQGSGDRQQSRQDATAGRQETRQDSAASRQQSRQDYGRSAQSSRQDYYDDHWDNYRGSYPYGAAVAAGAAGAAVGYAAGAATGYVAGGAAAPVYYQAPPCTPTVVSVGGTTYYQCGPNWYTQAYSGSGVAYIAVPPPGGY